MKHIPKNFKLPPEREGYIDQNRRINVKDQIQYIHDNFHPQAYFFTQTSATGAGYLFKEVYSQAWPNEPKPKMLTIGVREAKRQFNCTPAEFNKGIYDKDPRFRELVEEVKKKISRYTKVPHKIDGNIALIDEYFGHLTEGQDPLSINKNHPQSWQIADRALRVATEELGIRGEVIPGGFADDNRNFKSYWTRNVVYDAKKFNIFSGVKYEGVSAKVMRVNQDVRQKKYDDLKEKIKRAFIEREEVENHPNFDPNDISTWEFKDQYIQELEKARRNIYDEEDSPIHRKAEAKKRVASYKRLGREIGEEIKQEQRKKQGLEGKVTSVIAISGLALSLFFLSSNITGNAIGNLTNSTSNYIGVIFLLLGIVGSFFYFRNRNR